MSGKRYVCGTVWVSIYRKDTLHISEQKDQSQFHEIDQEVDVHKEGRRREGMKEREKFQSSDESPSAQ